MDASAQIERVLRRRLAESEGAEAPPRLSAALRHAVFPGGARIRPRLCLAVTAACQGAEPAQGSAQTVEAALGAAAAIELLHCASLVHDDLPCFDDSALRRGCPSVQAAFGEALAVLAGDALIVLAFETLAVGCGRAPRHLPGLLRLLARGAGMPGGIVAGQGWESETAIDLATYHCAKTSSLFQTAAAAGALCAGADPRAWGVFGERLGDAYQAADDIRDEACSTTALGKPAGRDRALGRPSLVAAFGLPQAVRRLQEQVAQAIEAIPPGAKAGPLREQIAAEMARLLPAELRLQAA